MPSALFVTTVVVTLDAFLLPFADRFRAEGWRVDALANGAASDIYIAKHFDHCYDIGWSRSPLSPDNLLGAASRLRRIVEDGGYDIVHVHTPVAAFVTRWALRSVPKATRPTLIYTAHGFHFFEGQHYLKNAIFRSLEELAAGWTDYLVTINHEDFDEALKFRRIDAERVRYLPGIGVDVNACSPSAATPETRSRIRSELEIAEDAFVVTMVAEFAPVKRHSLAIDAIARVTDPDVVVVFVGDGPLRETIEQEAVRLGISSKVRFAGYRRDVPDILAASDAGMLVSEREGLARSVLEEMATGLPIIGTATRGIVDAVGTTAGWIVEQATGEELAAAIDLAASDRTEARRRGEAARERACTEFALGRLLDSYEELYAEALASRL